MADYESRDGIGWHAEHARCDGTAPLWALGVAAIGIIYTAAVATLSWFEVRCDVGARGERVLLEDLVPFVLVLGGCALALLGSDPTCGALLYLGRAALRRRRGHLPHALGRVRVRVTAA